MFARKFMIAAVLGMTSLVPTLAFAGTPTKAPCALAGHRVTAVTAYRQIEHSGRGSTERLAGAQVFVQAEPGLTAEWLRLTLERHLSGMQGGSMADCPLDMKGVRIQVDSAGAGFAVKIIANSSGQAKEVLRRAELLLH